MTTDLTDEELAKLERNARGIRLEPRADADLDWHYREVLSLIAEVRRHRAHKCPPCQRFHDDNGFASNKKPGP